MAFSNKQQNEEKQVAADEQRRLAENRIAEAASERERQILAFISSFTTDVRATVSRVGKANLYTQTYIPVDAQMSEFGPANGLGLQLLDELGSKGWSIDVVIPRTYGGFESYKISKTTAYGVSGWEKDEHKVGLGGHVVGIYALLSYTVTSSNLGESEHVIVEAARASLPDGLTDPILGNQTTSNTEPIGMNKSQARPQERMFDL